MKKLKLKFKRKKKEEKPRKKRHIFLIIMMVLGIAAAIGTLSFGAYIVITAPDFTKTKLYSTVPTVLLDNKGEEFARIGQENRILSTYDDLPEVLIDALVATEDSRFFQHNGFDAARFLKASIKQVMGQDDAGGASTLTMQVAKNTYSKSENNKIESSGIKGIIRKFKDIYMSIFKIEKAYTKEEIIEFYVNSQWFQGGSTYYSGIYGVEQGSQSLFGKSVKDLSLPEASLLVGMFNNPTYFDPIKHPERAKTRQKIVLDLMVRHGYITKDEASDAAAIPIQSLLKIEDKTTTTNKGYQAFIDYVLQDVEEKTGSNPAQVPMTIYTTLDRSIQDVIVAFENGELYKFTDDKVQNGIAVTSTIDGSVVALGPGRNYVAKGDNRALMQKQPGSTAKPIIDYGPWIEYGNASPGNLLFDEPYTYSNGTPLKNYDGRFEGLITFKEALIDSRNIPALQAFQQTTEEQKAEFAKSLGIDLCEHDNNGKAINCELFESKSIGGWKGISPLESSAAYAAFARGGYYIEPYAFTKIIYTETEQEIPYKYTKNKVMSEETAYIITSILQEATGRNVAGPIKVAGTEVASKSGTTTISAADAKQLGIPTNATPNHWVNTYTSDYSISLWYGYDNNKQGYLTSTTGGRARRSIMSTLANKIYKQNAKFTRPSGVVDITVEDNTIPLKLASDYTPTDLKHSYLFKQGTEPTEVSSRFSKLDTPTNGNALVNGSSITITWDPIKTPAAIDTNELQTYFNENYREWSAKYYQERIAYNNAHIGTLGYQVYLENTDGSLISLGYTNSTSYTYVATSNANLKFVIKSAYSIFKNNMSDGLTIHAKLNNSSSSSTDTTSLKNLVPNHGTLSPTFNKDTTEYNLTMSENIQEIIFTATPIEATSTVSNTTCALTNQTTSCKITVTDESKKTKTYTIYVKKEETN